MRAVVVSLDAELALGFHDLDRPPWNRVGAGRSAWRWLVDAFETHSVPATWAVVGHLFLDECDGEHADHPAVDGWFDHDPGGDESTAPNWFGQSLISAVLESDVNHEIGTHTFSHVEFGRESTSRPIARAELERCVELADRWEVSLDSVVFPRNNVGHLDAVSDAGLSAYRGMRPAGGRPLSRVRKGIAYTVGQSAPPIVDPTVDANGLVNVPASLFLFGFEGPVGNVVQTLNGDPVVRKVRQGLSALARRDDGVLHLWLHPNNLVNAGDFERIERVLELVDWYRAERGVPVRTMREVAAAVLDDE